MSAATKPSVFPSFSALIESLDHEGRGVAHVDGKVVFVEGALPRERVQYEPSRKKKHFETAKLVSITRESSDRTSAECGFYEICGGCAQQHATPGDFRMRGGDADEQGADESGAVADGDGLLGSARS